VAELLNFEIGRCQTYRLLSRLSWPIRFLRGRSIRTKAAG